MLLTDNTIDFTTTLIMHFTILDSSCHNNYINTESMGRCSDLTSDKNAA